MEQAINIGPKMRGGLKQHVVTTYEKEQAVHNKVSKIILEVTKYEEFVHDSY